MTTPFGWMLENTFEAAALIALVALLGLALPHRPAVRHLLWLLVLIKLIAPPLPVHGPDLGPVTRWIEQAGDHVDSWWSDVGLPGPQRERVEYEVDVADRPGVAGAAVPGDAPSLPAVAVAQDAAPSTTPARSGVSLEWWLLGAWGLGALFVGARTLWRARLLQRAVNAARPAPAELLRQVRYVARVLDTPAPQVALLPGLRSPMLCTLGTPTLLWPTRGADEVQFRFDPGILAHELAHLRRRDHWVARLELLAGLICWWHPLYWFVRRRVRACAEQACDAWAVWAFPARRRDYAESLIDVAARPNVSNPAAPALAVVDGAEQDFQRRLKMIMENRVSRRGSPVVAVMALAVTGTLLPAAWGGEPVAGGGALLDADVSMAVEQAQLSRVWEQADEAGENKKALKAARKLVELVPDSGKAWARLGEAQRDVGQLVEARLAFDRQLELGFAVPEALYDLAALEALSGQHEAALEQLEGALSAGFGDLKLLSSDPAWEGLDVDGLLARGDDIAILKKKAWEAFDNGDYKVAAAIGEKILWYAPNDASAMHRLALARFGLRDAAGAKELTLHQLELGFAPAVAHYNLACAESMLGNLDASAEWLELSLAAGFDDAKLLLSDGDLANLRDAGRMAEPTERAKRAIALGDKASKAIKHGDSAAATKLLVELTEVGSLSPLGPGKLADAFLAVGAPDKALQHFRDVVLGGKGVAWGLAGMARAQLALGRLDEARAHLTAAADVGWADTQALIDDPTFDALRGGQGWSELVAQVVANGAESESYDLAGWKLKEQKERHAKETAAAELASQPRTAGR